MTIQELFTQAGVTPERIEGEADVATMTMDSRRVKAGSMFVCMPPAGEKSSDSNSYLPAAFAAGAGSVLTYSVEGFEAARRLGLSAALLAPPAYQDSLWRLCKVAFGNPSASMKVIGVTGTNGKTTTAWLIRDMLKALGVRAAYLGTLGFQLPDEDRELANTTPFAIELNELLAEARDKGVEAIAMEVSSHALAEKRVDGIEFDAAVFTNLTQDHLDFHGTMAEYEAAKLRLFKELPKQSPKHFVAAFNCDDPAGLKFSHVFDGPMIAIRRGYDPRMIDEDGLEVSAGSRTSVVGVQGLIVEPQSIHVDSLELIFYALGMAADHTQPFRVPLGGSYNVENSASAAAGLMALGYTLDGVRFALPQVRPVPGRFEPVQNDAGIGILVDYAHTPDALEKLLDAVRPLTTGRVITVFGCGGDRDRTKRPKMAKAASERSDFTVVTSDNPRTEDPVAIVEEVAAGIQGQVDWSHVPERESSGGGSDDRATVIVDRGEAIAFAIRIAKPGDVVVIAGKGHENYQIIGRTKHPMDDRELARDALGKRAAIA